MYIVHLPPDEEKYLNSLYLGNSLEKDDIEAKEYLYNPQNKNCTAGKAKVVAAGWGTYLNAALAIYRERDDLKKRFWKNILAVYMYSTEKGTSLAVQY